MDARERHARAKSIFLNVLERNAADRPALIASAARGDAEMQREVEGLLRNVAEVMEGDASFPRQPPIAVGIADEVMRDSGHAGSAGGGGSCWRRGSESGRLRLRG